MNAKEKMALELSKINGNSVTVGNNESGLQTHTNAPKTVLDYIRAMTPEIAKALPLHIKPERLIRNKNLITPETDYMCIDAVEQFVLC